MSTIKQKNQDLYSLQVWKNKTSELLLINGRKKKRRKKKTLYNQNNYLIKVAAHLFWTMFTKLHINKLKENTLKKTRIFSEKLLSTISFYCKNYILKNSKNLLHCKNEKSMMKTFF